MHVSEQVVDKANAQRSKGLQNLAGKHLVQHPLSANIASDVVSQKVIS